MRLSFISSAKPLRIKLQHDSICNVGKIHRGTRVVGRCFLRQICHSDGAQTDFMLSLRARQPDKASWHEYIHPVFKRVSFQIENHTNNLKNKHLYNPTYFCTPEFQDPAHSTGWVSKAIKCYFYLPHSPCTTKHLN